MEKEPDYLLLRLIDPTIVNIPIRDKFSKLTLSSNKKKQEEKMYSHIDLNKRSSASRNLIEQLDNSASVLCNPLLQSYSSSPNTSNINFADIGHTMEPLQVSEASNAQQNDISNEVLDERSQFKLDLSEVKEPDDAYTNDENSSKGIESELIYISSTTDTDSESIIVLSDNSARNVDDINFDFSLITSDIPNSGQTTDGILPNTLSNDRADRVELFLQNVVDVLNNCPTQSYIDTAEEDILSKAELIAKSDTLSMNFTSANTNQPRLSTTMNESCKGNSVTSENDLDNSKRLAMEDTEVNTSDSHPNSIHNSHDISANSLTSINNDKTLEESIVVPETCSEAEVSKDASKSFDTESTQPDAGPTQSDCATSNEAQCSQVGISLGNINISARINIKIQLSQVASSSDDDGADGEDKDEGIDKIDESSKSSNQRGVSMDSSASNKSANSGNDEICGYQSQQKSNEGDPIMGTPGMQPSTSDGDNSEVFITQAKSLLDEIYGQSWQTPDAMKLLRKNSGSFRKTATKRRTKEKQQSPPQSNCKQLASDKIEESVLDDFSMFRRNISGINLNSTAMSSSLNSNDLSTVSKANRGEAFKLPQVKEKGTLIKTISGRRVQTRWRQLVDSDSEGDNASDDPDIDKSELSSTSASDRSWKKSGSSSECDSNENKDAETNRRNRSKRNVGRSKKGKLIYLDLSKDEVSIHEGQLSTPLANHDATFEQRLKDILDSCRYKEPERLQPTPKTNAKTKRKLFTANFGYEDEEEPSNAETQKDRVKKITDKLVEDMENISINQFELVNKKLESVKSGKPIFQITPTRTPATSARRGKEASNRATDVRPRQLRTDTEDLQCRSAPINRRYGFLKSLELKIGKAFCDPEALMYRENYKQKKEELTKKLYDLYNEQLFENKLNVPVVWNKKLLNTAGRCLNKKRLGIRSSVIELSEKVLTSADRLRCTLIHELCHAATWIFQGEGGHGATWKSWAHKANCIFFDLPKIGVCHQYDIEYKYTYKCTLCGAKSHAHSKSRKVDNIRCLYCHGAIEIFLNKKDKGGNVIATPVREPTGFAKFVKDNYNQYKAPNLKHADVMKILSNEFNALKLSKT